MDDSLMLFALLFCNCESLVVWDVHGQILDLCRIIKRHGLPHRTKYLFLEDLVDRRDFSFEVVTFVFLIKVLFLDYIAIIYENHEFQVFCGKGCFNQEIVQLFYHSAIFYVLLAAFAVMSLAAIINSIILAIHGGIGPDVTSLQQLCTVTRLIVDFDYSIVDSLLWSDPSDQIEQFQESPLQMNSFQIVIRGYECISEGCLTAFDGHLYVVFSVSNYYGSVGNKSVVLVKKKNAEMEIHQFPSLPRYARPGNNLTTQAVNQTYF